MHKKKKKRESNKDWNNASKIRIREAHDWTESSDQILFYNNPKKLFK